MRLPQAARQGKTTKAFAVLNARFHEQEAYIVAQAGVPGAITIATNMAGRGTDIQLGGNADMRIAQELADLPAGEERAAKEKAIRDDIAKLKAQRADIDSAISELTDFVAHVEDLLDEA